MSREIYENGMRFEINYERNKAKQLRNVEILNRFDNLRKENPTLPTFAICRHIAISYDLQPLTIYNIVKKHGKL